MEVIRSGWPEKKTTLQPSVIPYFHNRDELTICEGLIVKGQQIYIPKKLRPIVIKKLHRAHLGYDSMVRRARETVFWIGMANDLQQTANNCDVCQCTKPKQQKEPLIQHASGTKPFETVTIDLFEFEGKRYLITVDYCSNFFEIDLVNTITANNLIISLKRHFSRYGIPYIVVSDFGPQFANHVNPILLSSQFIKFQEDWNFILKPADPGYQWQNGKAESGVKIAKNMLKRTSANGDDQFLALLELRNTPRQDCPSPAQLLFGHQTRSVVPCLDRSNTLLRTDGKKRQKRKHSVKTNYDKTQKF